MTHSHQIPTSLKVVAGLFILNGASAAFEIFVSLVRGGFDINLGVVSLFVGLGLLRVSRGWKTCALVLTWIGLLGLPVIALAALNHHGPLVFKIVGQNASYMPKEVGLIYAALLFAICGWQYHVLTRRDIRDLFEFGVYESIDDDDMATHCSDDSDRNWRPSLGQVFFLGVVGVASVYLAVQWWRHLPPRSFGASQGHVFKGPGHIATAVPAFVYGTFDFENGPKSVAYFVRIKESRHLSSPTWWLNNHDSMIFVKGRRILPRHGVIKLFVADGHEDPHLVLLTGPDKEAFDRFMQRGHSFDDCAGYWNLRIRKHRPDLSVEPLEHR